MPGIWETDALVVVLATLVSHWSLDLVVEVEQGVPKLQEYPTNGLGQPRPDLGSQHIEEPRPGSGARCWWPQRSRRAASPRSWRPQQRARRGWWQSRRRRPRLGRSSRRRNLSPGSALLRRRRDKALFCGAAETSSLLCRRRERAELNELKMPFSELKMPRYLSF